MPSSTRIDLTTFFKCLFCNCRCSGKHRSEDEVAGIRVEQEEGSGPPESQPLHIQRPSLLVRVSGAGLSAGLSQCHLCPQFPEGIHLMCLWDEPEQWQDPCAFPKCLFQRVPVWAVFVSAVMVSRCLCVERGLRVICNPQLFKLTSSTEISFYKSSSFSPRIWSHLLL